MKLTYLALFVLGTVLPYSQLVPWLLANGLDLPQLWRELSANRISSFFGLDVIVSAIVVLASIHDERRRRGLPRAWLPVAATLLIGVSAGLPLLLYMRREERVRAVRPQGRPRKG